MNYRVTPIEERHIEGFRAAVDSVAHERAYLAFLEAPPLKATTEFVLENLRAGHPQFVALVDETVVGWCDITSLHRPVFAHSGVLGMGVVAEYRGHGIGKALIRATLDRAKSIGLTRVELTVREPNKRAFALYEKMGFVVEGVKKNAVRVDGRYENLIAMGLLLTRA
jgi:RimJ/RimL family protein N-acetyltransferase